MAPSTTPFPSATILAYPRVGRGRELKRALEAHWAGRTTAEELAAAHEGLRRVEWTIGIEYDEDVPRVRGLIQSLLQRDERILTSPEPTIVLHQLNSSSVDILVRAWVASSDLWAVYWDFNERVYAAFNEQGIGFPFPQLTLHQGK